MNRNVAQISLYALFAAMAAMLQGCTLGHREFYRQTAPESYASVRSTKIFEYSNVNLRELYEILFSDYLILGESSFNGPYEDPVSSRAYANSIGADVFIVSTQFSETRTSFMPITTPTTSTTTFSGMAGGSNFYGLATSYGTQTTQVPISVSRYDQQGMYLRNAKHITPLWEQTSAAYPANGTSIYDGLWSNDKYLVKVYVSEKKVVGFIDRLKDKELAWKHSELKFVFNPETGAGVYLMGDKTPMPAKFATNQFGHFEVKLIPSGERFSFARVGAEVSGN
ncbi:MAG: hypothetical protein NDJ89_18115 [Oligoflexia bacterium]|nr:hypothetical protein [Oligoflexia bacterium]